MSQPNDEPQYWTPIVVRLAGGVISGAVLGFFIAVIFIDADDTTVQRQSILLKSVLAGIGLATAILLFFGNYTFRGMLRRLLVGVLFGIGGGIVIAIVVKVYVSETQGGKLAAQAVITVIYYGIPICGLLGGLTSLLVGFLADLIRNRNDV